jgi:hypothetical protein
MDGERVDATAAAPAGLWCVMGSRRGAVWILIVGVFAILSASSRASGGEVRTITLRDGSTIAGEVVSLSGGVYTFQSATMGTITVRESDVRSITTTANTQAPAQLDAVQTRIAADPEAVQAITALQNDPEVQAVIADPEVQRALQSGDVEALLANPKFTRFAADPKIEELAKKLSH